VNLRSQTCVRRLAFANFVPCALARGVPDPFRRWDSIEDASPVKFRHRIQSNGTKGIHPLFIRRQHLCNLRRKECGLKGENPMMKDSFEGARETFFGTGKPSTGNDESALNVKDPNTSSADRETAQEIRQITFGPELSSK
jgi:hypothetical protein